MSVPTPESDADGWIEWHGGENPVPGRYVDMRFRLGDWASGQSDSHPFVRRWSWSPDKRSSRDIIAYRIVPTPEPVTDLGLSPQEEGGVGSFQLDTTGRVVSELTEAFETYHEWSDLDAFAQGYVEALFSEGVAPQTMWPCRFQDLAPETLARIIADCAKGVDKPYMMGRAYNANDAGGRCFWADRQAGFYADLPPLTVQLGDDGKVRFARATGASS